MTGKYVLLAMCFAGASGWQSVQAQQGRPLDLDQVQIRTTRLADNLYVAEAAPNIGNVVFLNGPEGVLLVDSMTAPLHDRLMAAIRATGAKGPIRYVINTHLHGDHTGGNSLMAKEGAVIIAQDSVLRRMSAPKSGGAPATPADSMPTITYSDHMSLRFGGQDIDIIHGPPAHTDGDSIVYFRQPDVMHVGDLPASLRFNNIGIDDGGSVDGMIAGGELEMKLGDSATRFVSGHTGPVVSTREIIIQDDMIRTVRDRIAKLVRDGATLQQAIDAKPTKDFDAGRLGGSVTPERWVTMIYTDLSRRAASAAAGPPTR